MTSSIRDFFVDMGSSAERRVDELSGRADQLQARAVAYDQIESTFAQMAADGVIDPKEMASIISSMRAAGLETHQIEAMYRDLKGTDASVRVDGSSRLESELARVIGKERANVSDQLADVSGEVDKMQFFVNTGYASAADFNKKEHDVYMEIIRKFVA